MASAIGSASRLVSSASAAARTSDHLPTLLSVIAGTVDVTGYLTLGGLFTAHVTGNIVVIAALLLWSWALPVTVAAVTLAPGWSMSGRHTDPAGITIT